MTSQSRRKASTDIFRYLDYRKFLGEYYRREKPRGFSYRTFAREAGLSAPNYLKLVIDGARNLTPRMARRFAVALGLGDEAQRYFCVLVAFSQAETASEKVRHHESLLSFRRCRNAHRLESSHAEYHSSWYVPAIRELLFVEDVSQEPSAIARSLLPPITTAEAKRALSVLVKLGLVRLESDGRLRPTTSILTTGPETSGLHIARYHEEMARRAVASIALVPPEQRDISSLTVAVGTHGLAKLKERIQAFRRELLELSEQENGRSQVVQLNLQLFPLSVVTSQETLVPERQSEKEKR